MNDKNKNAGEEEIASADILAGLYPLMKDYFEGEICLSNDGSALIYHLPSGEEFCIVAGRIA